MPTISRQTEQRRAIVRALRGQAGALTAKELHERLAEVGLATVYRNIHRMVESGELDAVRRPSGELAYRACGDGHHHHLVCRACGRVVEIHDCALDDWSKRLAKQHDFVAIEHETELFGTCTDCAKS